MRAHEADAPCLLDLAKRLHEDCRRLEDALGELETAEPEQIEDGCRNHLEGTEQLRGRISAAARDLAAPQDDQTAAAVRQAGRLLAGASLSYRRLAERVAAELADVERRLADIQRGTKALRGYRQGARIRA